MTEKEPRTSKAECDGSCVEYRQGRPCAICEARSSDATHVHYDRLRDGTRVRVDHGEGRFGTVVDSVQGEAKVQLDGDEHGTWQPNYSLEIDTEQRTNEASVEWAGRDPRDVERAKELGKTFGLNAVRVGVLIEHFDEVRRQAQRERSSNVHPALARARVRIRNAFDAPSIPEMRACLTDADLLLDIAEGDACSSEVPVFGDTSEQEALLIGEARRECAYCGAHASVETRDGVWHCGSVQCSNTYRELYAPCSNEAKAPVEWDVFQDAVSRLALVVNERDALRAELDSLAYAFGQFWKAVKK